MNESIAFVGGGQMAGSLIGGLLAAGWEASRLRVAEPSVERAAWLRQHYGVTVADAGAAVVDGAQAIVLAVKPQSLREATAGLRAATGQLVISIAAGVRLETLAQRLGRAAWFVRTMPNTPALLGAGVTGMYAEPSVPVAARDLADRVLGAVGRTCWLPAEADLDAVTALSGSGPAYYFLLTEALIEAATAQGLAPATARLLAEQTLVGAARMVEAGGKDVATLRRDVTSKGGTTEAALARLESGGLRRLLADALSAAQRRSRELGDQLAAGA